MNAVKTHVLILFLDTVFSISIGKIDNCAYSDSSNSSMSITADSCHACLCSAFGPSNNSSFIALNCFDHGRRCELFPRYSTSYTMLFSQNSTFFFYSVLPSIIATTALSTIVTSNTIFTTATTQRSTTPVTTTFRTTERITITTSSFVWNRTGSTVAGSSAGTSGLTTSELQCPYTLAFDTNFSLYITDSWNHRIQKFTKGIPTAVTVAGSIHGTAGANTTHINMPVGIVLDPTGNIYFTDRNNHRVMFWAKGASFGTTIAGAVGISGSANNRFNHPSDLTRNHSTGTLFIADTFNHRIMQYLANASSGTVVAGGNGQGTATNQLSLPFCFAFDASSNSFLIANYGAHTIVRWVLGATSWTLVAGVAGSAGSSSIRLHAPLSVVLDRFGNMYVADSNNHRIQLFLAGQSNGTTIAGVTGSLGTGANQFNYPYWAILDDELNLYVADTFNHRVQRFQRL